MSSVESVSYFELGASLYTPCTHPQLTRILTEGLAGARSMIFCCEDAVAESDLPLALANLKQALQQLPADCAFRRFVRPRNAAVLAEILAMPDIEKIDGFVLPKADLNTLPDYKRVLDGAKSRFALMPTLETVQVLDAAALPRIRTLLDNFGHQTVCLRIGGNDLMSLMGLKRFPALTAYDTPLRMILDQLVLAFRPFAYHLSAPVFDFIDDEATLMAEVKRDISYGFYAKTAIHPQQLAVIEGQYSLYMKNNQQQANAVLDENAQAVFLMGGQMMEKSCHSNWALQTVKLLKSRSRTDH